MNRYNLFLLLILLAAGCQPAQSSPFAATVPPVENNLLAAQIVITVNTLPPPSTSTATASPTLTHTPAPTYTPSVTPLPPSPTPTPPATPIPQQVDHYVLARPISRDFVDWLDRTYPYGWTQYGGRETHHGVEFVNPRFTPVLAAAGGLVIYAGNDSQTLFGPQNNFYGNLVVLEHGILSPERLPVYTLYAHLQRVDVQTGQQVESGTVLGSIGDTGIAIGPHLHFEVRVGDPYDYGSTRNPDLWIYPYPKFGTLAGRVTNASGQLEYGLVLQIRKEGNTRYAFTYADDSVNSDAAWGENFTHGDLPEGQYEVIVSERSSGSVRFRQTVTITSGKTTWVDVQLDK